MDVEARIALYEKLYTQEVERRDRIQARLNFPLAILLAFSGLASFIIQNTPPLEGIYAYSFGCLLAIAIIATLISFIFLSRVLLSYSDCLVASPDKMEAYHIELENYNGKSGPFQKLTDKKFTQYLLNTFREAGTQMGNRNDQRSESLYAATRAIITAIAALLLSLVPFYLADNLKPTIESRNFTCQNKSQNQCRQVPEMSKVMYLDKHRQIYQNQRLSKFHHDNSAVTKEKLTEN